MRKILLSALTTAAILSGGMSADRAATTSTATAPTLGTAAANAALVREAVVLCGSNGCTPVQTKAPQKRKFQALGHG
jgi:hypothetical protein